MKNHFKITSKSIEKIKNISNDMEKNTFHLHTHILYDLRTHIGKKEINYLEIGSYAGGSASLMVSHPYKTNCFAVDLGDQIDPSIVNRNVEKFKNNINAFKYFIGNSQDYEIINKIHQEVGNVDILFIDGDHSKNGVISDFLNYNSLVKSKGYICFDDYLDHEFSPNVRVGVDEIVNNLSENEYNIIGLFDYPELIEFTTLKYNNIYIIQKK
jgi:cephalosporin hydroxylase